MVLNCIHADGRPTAVQTVACCCVSRGYYTTVAGIQQRAGMSSAKPTTSPDGGCTPSDSGHVAAGGNGALLSARGSDARGNGLQGVEVVLGQEVVRARAPAALGAVHALRGVCCCCSNSVLAGRAGTVSGDLQGRKAGAQIGCALQGWERKRCCWETAAAECRPPAAEAWIGLLLGTARSCSMLLLLL